MGVQLKGQRALLKGGEMEKRRHTHSESIANALFRMKSMGEAGPLRMWCWNSGA